VEKHIISTILYTAITLLLSESNKQKTRYALAV